VRMSRTHTQKNYLKKSFGFRDKNKLNFGKIVSTLLN
jgi:hypothetical protein